MVIHAWCEDLVLLLSRFIRKFAIYFHISLRDLPCRGTKKILFLPFFLTRTLADDHATPIVTAKKMVNSRQSTKALTRLGCHEERVVGTRHMCLFV